jgi:alanyl-tRNA synthetase
MTARIYYTDPSCREFDAVVTAATMHEGRPAVTLDRTAFYPSSGGQPFDTGTLKSARVVDVIDVDDSVLHVLDRPVPAGARVRGCIDWDRRLDHMQQHTGQHVLSAAFDRLGSNRTVSFHMGADLSSIDLEREASWPEIDAALDSANRVVWEDRAVSIRFVSDAEAGALPLRKPPARGGTLRLIEVAGFDLSACGGTHVSRTGSIGMIAVTAAEKFKGGSRIAFACGGRALRVLRAYREAVAGSVRILSVLPGELPAAIEKLQQEAKELRKSQSRLQEQLAGHEAERLFAAAPEQAGRRVVTEIVSGFDASALKAMASALAARGRTVAALVSASSPVLVVIARSAGEPGDAGAILRQLVGQFGGKGGGKPDLAQGGGLNADPAAVVAAIREILVS